MKTTSTITKMKTTSKKNENEEDLKNKIKNEDDLKKN